MSKKKRKGIRKTKVAQLIDCAKEQYQPDSNSVISENTIRRTTTGLVTTVLPFSRSEKRSGVSRRLTTGVEDSHFRPFLRWAGGKQLLLPRLLPFLPPDVATREYWEPFLGAGSMFFALRPRQAFLSDTNLDLIECYRQIRDAPALVSRYTQHHARCDNAEYYAKIRMEYNSSHPSAAQAARFIYLNRTCFNGIYRVNLQGEYNVPYGRIKRPHFPSSKALKLLSQTLRSAEISDLPFSVILDGPERGSFVYLDPPYPPINGTAFFTHYTMDRFSDEDQRTLAELVHILHSRGVLFMMTNADTPLIRSLYGCFRLHSLPVTRYITCKARKHRANEVVVTNYEVRI